MRINPAILLGLMVVTLNVHMAYGVTLTASNGDGMRGTTGHKISVELDNELGIVGVQFDMVFDSNTFSIEDVDSTERSEFFDVFVWNQVFPGLVRIIMLDINLDQLEPGSGSIADFYFSIAEDALPGLYPLRLEDVQASDSITTPLDPEVVNGLFEVTVILDSLRINPRSAQVACAETQLFQVVGYDNVGPPIPLDAEWTVSPMQIGFIDATGLFTGNSQNTGWIRATYETWSDSILVEVIPGEVINLNIDPDSTILNSGMQQQFSVIGIDVCDNIFDPGVTWTVRPPYLGVIDPTGLFTAAGVGSGWIKATSNPSDSAFVTVLAGPLTRIEISPDSATLACADTVRFSAVGYDFSGNPIVIEPDWSVIPDSLGVVDSNGYFTAVKNGQGWIVAYVDDQIDSAFVAVESGSLAILNVQPDSATVISGQFQQFVSLGFDACGNHLVIEPEWSVAPEGLGMIDSDGLFFAQMQGEGWIFAQGSAKDSAYVLVQRGPAKILIIAPSEESAAVGDTIPYLAIASDGVNTWDVTGQTDFSTTDPAGTFADNLYIAGSEGEWEIIGTYSFDTVSLSDTAYITVVLEVFCERGDVNCDDEISPGDALCTFWRSVLGDFQEECLCECSEEAAEINCDGAITPGDALCIFWRSIEGEWPEDCECTPLAKDLPIEGTVSEIQVGSVRGKSQDVISVPLLVKNPEGCNAFALHMTYPANLLEFVTVSATEATEGWIALGGVVHEPGILSLGGFHPISVSCKHPVALVEIVFTVKDGIQGSGQFELTNLVDDLAGAEVKNGSFTTSVEPTSYALHQNYPNPFNATTDISFEIPSLDSESSPFISLKVYSILGQEVRSLANRFMESGSHTVTWDGKDESGLEVSSGIYFYCLTVSGSPPDKSGGIFTEAKRLVFMK